MSPRQTSPGSENRSNNPEPHSEGAPWHGSACEDLEPREGREWAAVLSLCPERERERERERAVAILAQVLHLGLGACSALLRRGGGGGLTRGCALGGAYPLNPVVLELHACRHWLKGAPGPTPRLLLNLKEALHLKVAL